MMVVKVVVMIYCSIICQTAPNNEGCLVVIIIAIIVVLSFIIIKTITIIIIMIYCSTICQAAPNEDCLVVVIGQGRDFLPLATLRALSTGQCQ